MKIKKKKGFTLIEILIVVAIIGIISTIFLVNINLSKKNSRINNAKMIAKTSLPAIIACKDGGGQVRIPVGSETGLNSICLTAGGLNGANWPALGYSYQYVAGGNYDSNECNFQISTNGDRATNIVCSCSKQNCQ